MLLRLNSHAGRSTASTTFFGHGSDGEQLTPIALLRITGSRDQIWRVVTGKVCISEFQVSTLPALSRRLYHRRALTRMIFGRLVVLEQSHLWRKRKCIIFWLVFSAPRTLMQTPRAGGGMKAVAWVFSSSGHLSLNGTKLYSSSTLSG